MAAPILVAFGVATIVLGFYGHTAVRDSLKQEQIVGTPDDAGRDRRRGEGGWPVGQHQSSDCRGRR